LCATGSSRRTRSTKRLRRRRTADVSVPATERFGAPSLRVFKSRTRLLLRGYVRIDRRPHRIRALARGSESPEIAEIRGSRAKTGGHPPKTDVDVRADGEVPVAAGDAGRLRRAAASFPSPHQDIRHLFSPSSPATALGSPIPRAFDTSSL